MTADRIETAEALDARFWAKVTKGDGCWEWTGALTSTGYGNAFIGGVNRPAHRVTWEAAHGRVPDGLLLDHLCRNRACVRPNHMEPVTNQENLRRGVQGFAFTGHCSRGHDMSEPGAIRIKPDGRRECRACVNDRWRAAYNARKGKVA